MRKAPRVMDPDTPEGEQNEGPEEGGGADPGEARAWREGPDEDDDPRPGVVVSQEALRGLRSQISASLAPAISRISEEAARSIAAALPRIDPAALNLPRIDMATLIPQTMQDALREQSERMAAQMRAVTSAIALSAFARPILPPGWKENIDRILSEYYAPNWPTGAGLRQFSDFIAETGWAIVWVPRSEVVAALVDADPDDREQLLLGHQAELVDDALEAMQAVKHESLVYLASCVSEVAESIRSGHYRAAQSLAASVLTEILQGFLRFKTLAEAKDESSVDLEEATISEFRYKLIVSTIPEALRGFRRHQGDPVPTRFNRHAVAHTADPIQFTSTNALIGLMLVAALVRECQELFDRGLMIEVDDDPPSQEEAD